MAYVECPAWYLTHEARDGAAQTSFLDEELKVRWKLHDSQV
jgi:hypothetical protein